MKVDGTGSEGALQAHVARLEQELAEARAALAAKPIVDRAQLFALTDAMPVLVSVIGRDRRYEFANRAYENWFGPEEGKVVGRHARDVLGPDAYAQLVQPFERALAGERVAYESDIPYKTGGPRHVHITFAPRRDPDGEISGVVALVVDLTGRFVDEVALRESEDHYRHAVELNPHTSWTSAPDGQLDHVNGRWLEWTGLSGLGSGYLDALHPDDRARTLESWTRSIETGDPYDIEHRVTMRDGTHRWMHSRGYPRRDDAGKVIKWYGTTEDIHDRKLAEGALAGEAAGRSAILGQLAEGVIVTDADGRITFVNEAAARIHGMARLEIGADDYAQTYRLFTEAGVPYPSQDLPLARAVRGETVTEARWLIRRPDTEVLAVGSARPVLAADGRQIGAVLTMRDDSIREIAEARVRRSEARYRSLFESIDVGFCVLEMKFDGEVAVDYRFVEINPAFERQTGLHAAEGRWAREMLPTLEQ
ncbi:MAG: PAS domain S-box protein, partial [Sphingomonadaceae bacterium]|nr:PAS domain S-box protein [Sphingomonadaceae bacterium]